MISLAIRTGEHNEMIKFIMFISIMIFHISWLKLINQSVSEAQLIPKCAVDEVLCPRALYCVNRWFLCDGEMNCWDNWDEEPANCRYYGYEDCIVGRHGKKCDQYCHCRNMSLGCSRRTGRCMGGCAKGWKGLNCEETCSTGSFGYDCASECHCRNGMSCNSFTGQCWNECESGWSGPDCQTWADGPKTIFAAIKNEARINYSGLIYYSIPAGLLLVAVVISGAICATFITDLHSHRFTHNGHLSRE